MIRHVLDPANYSLSLYNVPIFVTTALVLLLGLLVLIHERASHVSRLFALLTLTVSGWLFAFSWMYSTTDEDVAFWWAKAAYLSVPSIAPAIYHFTAVALQIYPRCKRLIWIGWGLSALFTAMILGTDALITGLHRYGWGYYPKYGWLSVPYLTFFFGLMLASLRNYWLEYHASQPGMRKRKIMIFMGAYMFAFLATTDYLPKFGVDLYPFGYLPVLGWLGLVADAIWRHQFVNITPAFAAEQITNTMTEALLVFDRDGIVRVVNRAACQLFGYAETNLVGQPMALIHKNFFPKDKMEILLQAGSVQRHEVTYPVRQGEVLSLEISASSIRDRFDQPIAIVCIARDITERKQAEEALRTSEERFRSAFEETSVGMVMLDIQGRFLRANRAFCTLVGYSEDELFTKTFLEITHPEDLEKNLKTIEQLMAGQIDSFFVEKRYLHKRGHPVWVHASVASVRDALGRPLNFIAQSQDIAERKQAEEAIKASETRFRSVAQSANDAIVSADEQGHIISWNRGAEAIFGYREEEILDQPLTRLMPERYREGHRKGLERMRTTGEAHVIGRTVELHGLRKDGSEFPLELSLATWKTNGDTFYSGILRDITERKHLEEQLRQSQKMEAIGSLAGGIAHDFNNLLMVITGYSQLLLDRLGPNDLSHADIKEIKQAGDRAASLTQQLLAFSRRQMLKPELLDLNSIVAGMGNMLQRLIGENIQLTIRPAPALDMVKADRGQLEQVIMNLAVNARDAMPKGGLLTIETANVDLNEARALRISLKGGAYVALSITDTGCGMDPETQARIFEPFFTTKEPGKGTGLGLSTVYGIVNQSKGSVLVQSEPGKGSTFTIYLPRIKDEAKALQGGGAVPAGIPRGSETVLVVEDEDIVRGLLRKVLQANGYCVLEARSGQEALWLCQDHASPIHLLIADVVMPGMNGRELANRLTHIKPGMKVIFISGYIDDAVVRSGVAESQANFLQKPVEPVVLMRKVREVLERS